MKTLNPALIAFILENVKIAQPEMTGEAGADWLRAQIKTQSPWFKAVLISAMDKGICAE